MPYLILTGLAVIMLTRPSLAVYRLVRLPAEARHHWLPMCWHALRWRWAARNMGLAYIDKHHRRELGKLRLPFTTAARVNPDPVYKVRWPVARFRANPYGFTATCRTIPKVGRQEFADASQWLADLWKAHRVTVTQIAPGRVQLAALRIDPLMTPFGAEACPAGTYDSTVFPSRLLLGRDETGAWRHLALPNITGITLTGLPGAGKTVCVQGLMCQLAGSPVVSPLILDGKGSCEWSDWDGRAQVLDDDPGAAEDALAAEVAEMRRRHATVLEVTGYKNAWHRGPTPDMDLRLVVIDECQTYLDATQHRGDRKAEDRARRTAQLVSTLVRKGRSVLYLVVLATQQGTVDAFGSSQLRNNCALSVAFALRTTDAAVAALGEEIRRYADVSPTLHQGPDLVGVCTSTLRTGLQPFTRLRCPELTEQAVMARAIETARSAEVVKVPLRLPPRLERVS